MLWYWTVGCTNAVGNPFIAESSFLNGLDESSFERGESIGDWDPVAWLAARKALNDGEPDDVLQNSLGLPVFSSRLQQALLAAGIDDVEYLPIHVRRPSGEEIAGFAIANVLRLVEALDVPRSDVSVFPQDYFLLDRRGRVSAIRRAVLRESRLWERDIVRLFEFPSSVYVSERFRDVFVSAGCTGFGFVRVETSS